MRVLVTGWFSFSDGEATVGDLRAADVVRGWLDDAGLPYDLALASTFAGGVDWREVPPAAYSHLVFVCGPAHGERLDALLERFAGCRRVAVDVTLVPGRRPSFDAVLARDGPSTARPDLAISTPRQAVPLVGVVRAHPQPEYGDALALQEAHTAIDRALAAEHVASVELDTRVDPREAGRQSCAHIEAPIARMDAVVSTRLHGLVTALKLGVPAVAVDAVRRSGKVTAQAGALGWPHLHQVEDLDVDDLRASLRACLEDDARRLAAQCRDRAAQQVHALAEDFVRTLSLPHRESA